MTVSKYTFWGCIALVLALLLPVAAFAQQTTSALRVDTYDASGNPLPGVQVNLIDTRTGTTRSNRPPAPAMLRFPASG